MRLKLLNWKIGEIKMADRVSRDTTTREVQERPQTVATRFCFKAPEPPIGYKHRWIRESVLEYDDKTNVHKKTAGRMGTRSR